MSAALPLDDADVLRSIRTLRVERAMRITFDARAAVASSRAAAFGSAA